MIASGREHWQDVYRGKAEQRTSWFQPHLDTSLRWIDGLHLPPEAPVLDVGGGRSTLVDDLLDRGHTDVTVLDISGQALQQARRRLGGLADSVCWRVDDITLAQLPEAHYALWHDRALFHFLADRDTQNRYIEQAARAVRAGGHAVIATFAADGPQRCSGLPVVRYDAEALARRFAPAFEHVDSGHELHVTPSGTEQAFSYVLLRRGQAA